MHRFVSSGFFSLSMLASLGSHAGPAPPGNEMQITATRVPQSLLETPASMSVITGEELRARGATDLRTALAGLAGVTTPQLGKRH